MFCAGFALAQYHLPANVYTLTDDSIVIRSGDFEDTFVFGLGWASGAAWDAPVVQGNFVIVEGRVFAQLGLPGSAGVPASDPQPPAPSVFAPQPAAPRQLPSSLPDPVPPATPSVVTPPFVPAPGAPAQVTEVRFGGGETVRIVLDVPDLSPLARITAEGTQPAGEALLLDLPGLLPPAQTRFAQRGASLTFAPAAAGTSLRIDTSGAAYGYSVFTLSDPGRVVIDLTPTGTAFELEPIVLAEPVPATLQDTDQLSPGITHSTLRYPNGNAGMSTVHVLEVAPGAGEFRVVGSSETAATLSTLAAGSLAAINAGYFNTTTHEAIGLLRVDYDIQTVPTLNRASIGFDGAGARIDRVRANVRVAVNGSHRVEAPAGLEGVTVSEVGGQRAGTARQGVITVVGGRVLANRTGPAVVPDGGYALAYNPGLRELALVDPGDAISIDLRFTPSWFDQARYAVEAGPLLVRDGQPAFQPELEQFARGVRILDDFTSQAAIGVRADGTVLLVVAENMRAQDLVPLFLTLGAQEAMRLDSGGSAALYGGGRLLNRTAERRIVSAIVVVPVRN